MKYGEIGDWDVSNVTNMIGKIVERLVEGDWRGDGHVVVVARCSAANTRAMKSR